MPALEFLEPPKFLAPTAWVETKPSNHRPLENILHSGYHGIFVFFFYQKLPNRFSQWVPISPSSPELWDCRHLHHHHHLLCSVLLCCLWSQSFQQTGRVPLCMFSLRLETWLWAAFPEIIWHLLWWRVCSNLCPCYHWDLVSSLLSCLCSL